MTDKRNLNLARTLAVIGFLFWVFYVFRYVFGVPLFLANEEGPGITSQVIFIIYGYSTLLMGVFLGAVYKELRTEKSKGRSRIKIGKVLRNSLRSGDFWMGIFASPVVYVILLQAIDLENISITGVIALALVGLQNGFVCNTIADSLFEKKEQALAGEG